MGRRQQQKLLKRRKAAQRDQRSRSTAVLAGVVVTGMGAALLASPAVAAPGDTITVTMAPEVVLGDDGTDPGDLTVSGNALYFTTWLGRESLWRSVAGGAPQQVTKKTHKLTSIQQIEPFAGGVAFIARNVDTGREELWRADNAGVQKLYEAENTSLDGLTAVGGSLFFSNRTAATGTELWRSNGQPGGAHLVRDIVPGAGSSSPYELTPMGGKVAFSAYDAAGGRQLFVTDGSEATTTPLTSGSDSYAGDLVASGGSLFFSNRQSGAGTELWGSNGTVAGTGMIADLVPGGNGGYPRRLVAHGTGVAFLAETAAGIDQVWTSNGSAAGTAPVSSFGPGVNLYEVHAASGTLFAVGQTSGVDATQLWAVRSSGVAQVTSFGPIPSAYNAGVNDTEVLGDRLFFSARTTATGTELWSTDGGTATIVSDLEPGTEGSEPYHLVADPSTNSLWFSASSPDTGREIWKATVVALDNSVKAPSVTVPKQKKTKKKFGATVTVGAGEAVTATVTGTVKLPGVKKKLKLASRSVSTNGAPVSVTVSGKKKSLGAVKKALAKYRGIKGKGKQVKKARKKAAVRATVKVVMRDAKGNTATKVVKVTLR